MYPQGFVLKHSQKMKVGKYLESNYIQCRDHGFEVTGYLQPQKVTAYLFKMIENLIQERRQEEKLRAHKVASDHYKKDK